MTASEVNLLGLRLGTQNFHRLPVALLSLLLVAMVQGAEEPSQNLETLLHQYEKSQLQVPKQLLEKYDRYLEEHHNSSNEIETEITTMLCNDFVKALEKYEQRFKECRPKKKDIGSAWLDNLIKKLGMDYLKTHNADIKVLLGYTWQKRSEECESQEMANLTLKETALRPFLLHESQVYLKFFETLTPKEQKEYESSAKLTRALVTELKQAPSVQKLWQKERFYRYEAKAKRAPKELRDFFETEPSMKNPFDAVTAARLLNSKLGTP